MSQYNRQGGAAHHQYDPYVDQHQQHYADQASQSGYPAEQHFQQPQQHRQGYSQQGYAQTSHSAYDAPQPEYYSAPVKPQR